MEASVYEAKLRAQPERRQAVPGGWMEASVYEAKLRAQPERRQAVPGGWMEASVYEAKLRAQPERRRVTLGRWPPPKLLRSFDSPGGGVNQSLAPYLTPPEGE